MRLGTALFSEAGVAVKRYSRSYSPVPTLIAPLALPLFWIGDTRSANTSSPSALLSSPYTLTDSSRVQPDLDACASTMSVFFAASPASTAKKAGTTSTVAPAAVSVASKNEKLSRFQWSLARGSALAIWRPPPATTVQPVAVPAPAAAHDKGSAIARAAARNLCVMSCRRRRGADDGSAACGLSRPVSAAG